MRTDRRDVAKLVVLDFMLIHANDWYVVPFDLPVGTLCRMNDLVVRDVFGSETVVPRADAHGDDPDRRWTLFSTSDGSWLGNFFVSPPSISRFVQDGAPIEEVRLFRDEQANMVWGVERATPDAMGEPRPGHERAMAARTAPTPATSGAALRYQIQTDVPIHWIPFLPVLEDETTGAITLERAALRGPDGAPVLPAGRLLTPSATPYRLREEEVPREGVQVARRAHRVRGSDGTTHLWVGRSKTIGLGEGASGLRFDLATPTDGQPEP
jgi:hypothetical protein